MTGKDIRAVLQAKIYRCYKKAFPVKVAREKLIQDAGKQFDPELVRKFVECLDNGTINLVKAEEA